MQTFAFDKTKKFWEFFNQFCKNAPLYPSFFYNEGKNYYEMTRTGEASLQLLSSYYIV